MAEKRKSKRRSSILKSLDNHNLNYDGRHMEKRRVSFNREILVKEFHKPPPGQDSDPVKPPHGENVRPMEQVNQNPPDLSRVYTVEANESFYQMSTPIGMKKRRISGSTMPGRFSMIPVMEQSFIKDSDFEVFEENSPNVVADKNKITLPDVHKDDEGIQQQFACSPLDNFGEEMKAQIPAIPVSMEVVDMSLTLEEEQPANLSMERHSTDKNDTMTSTINYPRSPAASFSKPCQDITMLNKEELLGANQMDPLSFPVSLLTPPKPAALEEGSGSGSTVATANPKGSIVKELIKDSNCNEPSTVAEEQTVYGGPMSMTCSESMELSEGKSIGSGPVDLLRTADEYQPSGQTTKDAGLEVRVGNKSAEHVHKNETVSEYVGETEKLNNTGEDMELTLIDDQDKTEEFVDPIDKYEPEPCKAVLGNPPLPYSHVTVQASKPQTATRDVLGTEITCNNNAKSYPVLEQNPVNAESSHPIDSTTDTEKPIKVIASSYNTRSCNNTSTSISENRLTLPSGRAVMGKKRPIISSTAVVSKHLAIGSSLPSGKIEKTPSKVSAISHMKSPYLNRTSSAKKELSAGKKKKKRDFPLPTASPYNLRNSPSREKQKREAERMRQGNKTFMVTDASKVMERDPTTELTHVSTCTTSSTDNGGWEAPIPNEVQQPQQQKEESVDLDKSRDSDVPSVQEEGVESVKNQTFLIESSLVNKIEPVNEQNGSTIRKEDDALIDKTVVLETVASSSSPSTATNSPTTTAGYETSIIIQPRLSDLSLSDCENKLDSNWINDEFVSFADHSSDLNVDVTPSKNATPIPIQNIRTPPTEPIPTQSNIKTPSTQPPLVASAMMKPSPLLNKIDASSWQSAVLHLYPVGHVPSNQANSFIRSPGVQILDGTINQTVVEDVDISSTINTDEGSRKRWSIDRQAVDKLLSAMPGANTTLHLDVEYDQQRYEKLQKVELTIEEDEATPTHIEKSDSEMSKCEENNTAATDKKEHSSSTVKHTPTSSVPSLPLQPVATHVSSSQQSSVMYLDTANYSIPLDETITLDSSPEESKHQSHSHLPAPHSSSPSSNHDNPPILASNDVSVAPDNTDMQKQTPISARTDDSAVSLQRVTSNLSTMKSRASFCRTHTPKSRKSSVHNLTLPAFGSTCSSEVDDTGPHNNTLPTHVGHCGDLQCSVPAVDTQLGTNISSESHKPRSVPDADPQTSSKPQSQTAEPITTPNQTPYTNQLCSSDCSFSRTAHHPCNHSSANENGSLIHPENVSSFEKNHTFIECLETLHSRLEEIYNATSSRMYPEYSSNEQVKSLIKFYYIKSKACIYTLRCMIDYIRLNDMGDSVCDLPMSDWEEVPRLSSSEEDKRGPSIDKALWLREMARDVMMPLYKLCQDLMLSIERCFGWTITTWTEESVLINVRSQIQVIIGLETEGSNAGQKIKSVAYDALSEGGSVCSQLYQVPMNHKTVLEIPVMMQDILQCV